MGMETTLLRWLLGPDPETRRQRWLAKTVHGTKRFASKQLKDLAGVRSGCAVGLDLGERSL
jgi:hypothetical protein